MLEPVERGPARTRTRSRRTCRRSCRTWSASSAPSTSSRRLSRDRPARGAGRPARRGQPAVQPRLAPGPGPPEPARRLRGDRAAALERKESRGGHTREDYPKRRRPTAARSTSSSGAGTGSSPWPRSRCRRCRPSSASSSRRRNDGPVGLRPRADARDHDARLARRRGGRGVPGVPRARRGGHGRPRRDPPDPGDQAPDLAVPLELQGGQVRVVQRRGQRQAAAHVHDADGRSSPGRADHGGAAEDVPAGQGPGHRRVVQLRGGARRSRRSGPGRPRPTAPTG